MVTVLYIHSNTMGSFEMARWNVYVQRFLTRGISDWAVPFFFCLSGFWFGAKPSSYFELLRKKVHSLLIPYLIWAIVGALVLIPILMLNNRSHQDPIMLRTCFACTSVWDLLDRMFGIARYGPTWNSALWYVRTLVILFVLSPVWLRLLKWGKWIAPVIGLSLVVMMPLRHIPYISIPYSAVGWFLVGFWVSGREVFLLGRAPKAVVFVSGFAWIGCGIVQAVYRLVPFNLLPLCGIVFLWTVYDYAPSVSWMENKVAKFALASTFWVYCMHGFIMGYFLSGIPFVIGKSDIVLFVVMLGSPWMALATCLVSATIFKRFAPNMFSLMSGGRVRGR